MCLVVKNSEKNGQIWLLWGKILFLLTFDKKDHEKLGYSTIFAGIFSNPSKFAQCFPNNQDILQVLQLVYSKSSNFTSTNPEKLALAKFSLNNLYAQYLFDNFMWFYVDFQS